MTAPPTWLRVAEDVCQRILSGETPVGTPIASQQQLVIRHHVAPGTVKRALEHLTKAGVIEGRQGIGVFVLREPTDTDLGKTPTLDERVTALEEQLGELQARLADLYARDAVRYSEDQRSTG